MSKNIEQVYVANPITTNANTDLMYFGQSPYGVNDDAAMQFSDFARQFQKVAFNFNTASGANDAFTLTLTPAPTSYTDGMPIYLNTGAYTNNTTTPTLNVNGLGARTIVFAHGALAAGDLASNTTYALIYNANTSQFEVLNPSVSLADTFAVQTNAYNVAVDAGVANAYVVTLNPVPPSIVNALTVYMLVAHANTGASTITVNGTTKNIVLSNNTALSGGELVVGQMAVMVYSSTYDHFELINSAVSANTPQNSGYTTTVTSGVTTNLTKSSTFLQYFTGSSNQTVVLPDVTTLPELGFSLFIVNLSSASIAIQSFDTSQLKILYYGEHIYVTCLSLSDNSRSGWNTIIAQNFLGYDDDVTFNTITTDNGLFNNSGYLNKVTTTATSGGTTNLNLQSTYNQYFTGTLNHTLVLSSTSNASGLTTHVLNASTGYITVESNNLSTVVIVPPGTEATFIAISTADNTPASWSYNLNSINPPANSLTWLDLPGTSITANGGKGYIISNASLSTVTIPATVAEGTVFAVQGKGAGGWLLRMNTGQTCHLGASVTTSAGSLASTNQWDSVSIVCTTANTVFAVTSVIGNLTIA